MRGGASATAAATNRPAKVASFNRATLYRLCRMLHAYLSALAFVALMFFSVTGLLLNHPQWFSPQRISDDTVVIVLEPDALASALSAEEAASALEALLRQASPIRGAFKSADIGDDESFLRFTGVKGATDVFIDHTSGQAEVDISRANLTSIVHDLHRGKDAGLYWGMFIDVTAVVILVMSLVGLVLFFSLRFRLATSLKLIGASFIFAIALIVFLTP